MIILNENIDIQIGCCPSSSLPIRERNISKIHAQLTYYEKDGFYLKDIYSEYGTYVLLRKSIEISYCVDLLIGSLLF